MAIFTSVYLRCLGWASHRYATAWLAAVAFTEAIFFPIPPDVLLAPMALARRHRAWWYATVCTLASALGGLCGYLLGTYAIDWLMPIVVKMGFEQQLIDAGVSFTRWGFWFVFIAGFSPIPYKVFTIAAGMSGMALVPFIAGSIIGRSARYFLICGLIYIGGERMRDQLQKWMEVIGWSVVVLLAVVMLLFYLGVV